MKRVTLIFGLFCLHFIIGCTTFHQEFPSGKIIDLTYPLEEATIFWPTAKEFQLENVFRGISDKGYYYTANNFCTAEHGGTHIDAPIHFNREGKTLDVLPVDQLMGKGVVIDVTEKCAENRDYQVQIEDFTAWENKHGTQLNDVIVLLRTGFGKYWPDRVKYMGTDERGEEAVAKLHFPGLHPDAAKWLVNNRSIKAIGLDTPSIDYGQSTLFETHVILFKKNIPVFENVANLGLLPEKDFNIIALPIKIKGGSGGPLRIVAVVS